MKTKIKDLRLGALKRFAIAITALNIAGHLFLGFEQSWAHAVVAIITTYSLELFFEWLNCRLNHFTPRYKGGVKKMVHFLLPAHITAMAVSMLLFTNENLFPVIFACAVAICSKILFRVPAGNGASKHFLNPSNTGIAIVLILFPWIGIAPPYQFTESISGAPDWILPVVFIIVGSFLNTKFTKKMPLILAWFGGFFLQAVIRSAVLGAPLLAALNPMTGVAFLLFSFYMISDPATTPVSKKSQIIFGAAIAFIYSILVYFNVVFGQFFALLIVCTVRGAVIWIKSFIKKDVKETKGIPAIKVEPQLLKEYYTVNN